MEGDDTKNVEPAGWVRYASWDRTIRRYHAGEAVVRCAALPHGGLTMPLAARPRSPNRLAVRMGPNLEFAHGRHVLSFGGWWRSGLGRFDPEHPELTYGSFCLTLPRPLRFAAASTLNGSPAGRTLGVAGTIEVQLLRADNERTEAELIVRALPVVRFDERPTDEALDGEVTLWASAERP